MSRFFIGNFKLPKNQLNAKAKKANKVVREYYISLGSDVIAGDFNTYHEAKKYLRNVLLRKQ